MKTIKKDIDLKKIDYICIQIDIMYRIYLSNNKGSANTIINSGLVDSPKLPYFFKNRHYEWLD